MIHQRFRVWLYDLKLMQTVKEINFVNHVVKYESPEDGKDHPASELMESTMIMVGPQKNEELWEGDLVQVKNLFGVSSLYAVEWFGTRWILRYVVKKTIKEITISGLTGYQIKGNIYDT